MGKQTSIAIVGGGYVGLVTSVGFASLGFDVKCVEADLPKLEALRRGEIPLHEEGLQDLWRKHLGRGLRVAGPEDHPYRTPGVIFLCVGTPSDDAGAIDLHYIREAAREVGRGLRGRRDHPTVAVKSTVVPGTTEGTILPILREASGLTPGPDLGIAVCPEFLAEGSALRDFLHPDRVVVGGMDRASQEVIAGVHEPLGVPLLRVDLRTAEMIKYASNAFLAARVSLANEIGNLCKALSIDAYAVLEAVGMDRRVGPLFLRAGLGFGGSCFSKDLQALSVLAQGQGLDPVMVQAVLAVNDLQPDRMLDIARRRLGSLKGKRIAVLGLAFKGGTDDIRESRAIPLLRGLLKEGAEVVAYDPMANDRMAQAVPGPRYVPSVEAALEGADACLIATDWPQFAELNTEFGVMKRPLVIDGRRMLSPPGSGVEYEGLCW